jgi:ATP-dependent exoDNAse (exonuclease V) alpha subunit
MEDPQYRLERIHRHAGDVCWFAQWVREGKAPRFYRPSTEDVQVLPRFKVTDDMLLQADQILCGFNSTRVEKNRRVRELLGYKGLPQEGERLMVLQNRHQLGVFNGQQVLVTGCHDGKKPTLDFEADGVAYSRVPFDPETLEAVKPEISRDLRSPLPVTFAYCCTAHKYQGSEDDSILVIEEHANRDDWDPIRWRYTAASRSRKKLIWATAW